MPVSCPLCDRKSLLIYPVRYAVACPRGAAKAPALAGNFKIDGRAPSSVATAKYTLRAIRAGYLYTYDEKRQRLKAYMVLEDGIMWSFPPGVRPPPPDGESMLTQSCANAGDLQFMSLGRCVDVEHTPGADEATNLWIGWSNVLWTKTLVGKVNDANWRKQHMQCINVPAMIAGSATDTGEFQAHHKEVAHFAMDNDGLKAAFEFSNTPIKQESRQRKAADLIGQAMAQTPNKKGFIVAVNDPVGITNDLSELTVPSLNSGFNEEIYWKATSAQLLVRAEQGIRARADMMTGLNYGTSKAIADANAANMKVGAPIAPDMLGLFRVMAGVFRTGSFDQAAKEDSEKVENLPHTQQEAEDDAWKEAVTTVGKDGKPVSVIDVDALKRFPQEYQQALDAFRPTWQQLAHAHADWLKSQLLADWLAGVSDGQDIRSGFAYSESCAQAIGASAGTDACTKVLNDWLNQAQTSDTRNLLARALMFNQDDLTKAAASSVHGSDVQYESFMNLYKGAFARLPKSARADTLRDRLMLTAGNVIVSALTKTGESAGKKLVMIRLNMQAGVRINPKEVSTAEVAKWVLAQAKELGIDLDGSKTQQRKAASLIAHKAMSSANTPHSTVVVLEMDVDALQRTGQLEEGVIKSVDIPGTPTLKKWLGSSAPKDFNLGVATAVVQMVTLFFASKDWAKSDQFNDDENRKKFFACVSSVFGNVIESISGTVGAAHEIPHPLSSFILEQWAGANRFAKIGVYGGRALGSIAGAVLAYTDLFKNAPEAWHNKEMGLWVLYNASGALGAYVAVLSLTGSVPFFWPVFVASILVGIGIAILKASELKDWVSHSKFSTQSHYGSLGEELKAFDSAIGG